MGVGVARLLAGEPAAHGVGGRYAVTARLGAVAQVVGRFGFAMLVGRSAMTRLSPRHYGAARDSFG